MIQQALTIFREHLPRARPYFPHAAAVLTFAVLGWLNGYFQASRAVNNPNLTETWSVPNWSPYLAGPLRTLATNIDIWDGAKRQTAAKQPTVLKQAWLFVGTVRAGEEYAAVILMGDTGKVRRATPGDVLPNGEKIVSVGHGSMQLDVAGAQQEIKLFNQEKKR